MASDAARRRLRWVLFLPAGIGCSLLVQGAVGVGFGLAAPGYRTIPGVIENVVTAFAGGLTFTLFPALVSPRPWPVAVVMFAAGLLLRVAPIAYLLISAPYLRPRMPLAGAVIAATTLGGCLGIWLVTRVQGTSPTPTARI
jgi:hypothetical protein